MRLIAMGMGVCLTLSACRGGLVVIGDSDTAGGDADTDTDADSDADTDADVAPEDVLLYQALRGPLDLMVIARDAVDHGGCPTASVASSTDWTLAGPCARGGIDWTGSGTFRRTADGERMQWGTLAYDDHSGSGPISLTGETLVLGGQLDASNVGRTSDGELVFAHAHTLYAPDDVAMGIAAGSTGEYTVSGQLTVGGLGVFTLSGFVSQSGTCDQDFDAGDLEATGSVTFDFDLDGANDCDGCVPYGGTSAGEACGL